VRTAKIVGISPDEVRAEISALVRTNGGSHADDGDSAPDDKLKAAKATSARPKPKKK
jgi:hypothetical protein